MEEIKLCDDVFEQIKDFYHNYLSEEQELLIDELILNEELKKRYKDYGLCRECKQPNTGKYYHYFWCQSCNSKWLRQNFKNWTSGNHDVDEFVQNTQLKAKNHYEILEWIDYDRFENVEYLAKGGFGTTYKAIWKDGYISSFDSKNTQWRRSDKGKEVALKCLHNSRDITAKFLGEIESHLIMNHAQWIVTCHGISKNPTTNNFIIVMDYAKNGSLRQHLNNKFNSLCWRKKLLILMSLADGLRSIHDKGLIHNDLHCGNILSIWDATFITDLGLCQPANAKPSQKKYGVLPYVAPEILREKEYTQASDIYGFGIIAYEVFTGLPPYYDVAHEGFLAIKICSGLRPTRSDYKVPQLILDIIKQCWDADPLKRPKAEELYKLLKNLYDLRYNEHSLIYMQCMDTNNKQLSPLSLPFSGISYTMHPQAVYTSRLLDFKNLPEPKNA